MPNIERAELRDYYVEAYVRVRAATEAEAVEKIEAAFSMDEGQEVADDVTLTVCGGPWTGVEPVDEPECTCLPDLVARGGFRGGCPAHG